MSHYCSACGEVHGAEADPGIEIARINAERDVAVAKLAARTTREVIETDAATAVEVAGIEGETAVEVEAERDVADEVVAVVEAPPGEETAEPEVQEPETEPEPEEELASPVSRETSPKRGYWGDR